MAEDNEENWLCTCGKDCSVDNKDYYMLNDDLWLKINGKDEGMLCMDCVEQKLGRKLEATDISPCFLTLFMNNYTKDIMVKSGYKLNLNDLYTFFTNAFEDDCERIFQFYHTKKLYKFFQEISTYLEACKLSILETDGYKTEDFCLCPECIFEPIIFMNIQYGYTRTDNGKN